MFKKITILYLFLFAATLSAQEVKLTITDLLTIGGPGNPNVYEFRSPIRIEVDSKGNMFLQDYKQTPFGNGAIVQHFAPDGKFVGTVGRIGEGPGDFKGVGTFIITADDKLLIYDNVLSRTTLYDCSSRKFSLSKPIAHLLQRPEIFVLNKNKLLVHSKNYSEKENKNLLYIKSDDLTNTFYDFGHPSLFINSNDPLFEEKIQNSTPVLSLCVINENKILAAPDFYDGELTMLTNVNGEWKSKRFAGYKPEHPSFQKVSNEEFEAYYSSKERHASAGGISSLPYKYFQHAKSIRIFTYKNKYILHFFEACQHHSGVNYYIDVFSMEGNYLGKALLNSISNKTPREQVKYKILYCKDKDDNFYMAETTGGIPVVKKVKLDISF